jgi:hypothetical protein
MSEKYHNVSKGYIGVDFDGTLSMYHGWTGTNHLGEPIPAMVARVKKWLVDGTEVRIITARVHVTDPTDEAEIDAVKQNRQLIEDWCEKHLGVVLPVQSNKCYRMFVLYDDRARQVEPNTGRVLGEDWIKGKDSK